MLFSCRPYRSKVRWKSPRAPFAAGSGASDRVRLLAATPVADRNSVSKERKGRALGRDDCSTVNSAMAARERDPISA